MNANSISNSACASSRSAALTPTLSRWRGRGRTVSSFSTLSGRAPLSQLASRVPAACLPSPCPQGEGKREGRQHDLTGTFLVACLALLVGTLLFQSSARAQTLEPPGPRQGYYLSLGFHNGVANIREDGDSLGAWFNRMTTIRMGQMLTRRLGLGLQIVTTYSQKGEQYGTQIGLGLEGQVALTGRLAVNGGLALGVLQLHDKRVMNEELRGAFGAEYSLGVSYDFFPYKRKLSGGLGLAPIVQMRFLPGDNGTSFSGFAGLHISWWTGLPRNQLDLPPGEGYERD
jgi:hypothetical protein